MDAEWFEFRAGPAPTMQRVRWHVEADVERMARRRRGRLTDPAGLRLSWTGTSTPPDVVGGGAACTLLSQRIIDRLNAAGVRGLGSLGAVVEMPDGSRLRFGCLVVPCEVESVCFRRSTRGDDRLYRLSDPMVRGLDATKADFYILPAALGLHNVLVSRRTAELLQRGGYTNLSLRPLSELEVHVPDPEHALC